MIFVKYQNGNKRQGVVLALGGQCMRIAIQGSDDAVEYRLVSDYWVSEDCEIVTFEFAEPGFSTGDSRELSGVLAGESQTPTVHRVM
jgi:hypothetical protein